MTVRLGLGPDNDLELTLPSGVRRYVPVGPHSTQLLWRILWSATSGGTEPAVKFPAQRVIDQWAEEIMPGRRAEETEARAAERREAAAQRVAASGFDIDFNL